MPDLHRVTVGPETDEAVQLLSLVLEEQRSCRMFLARLVTIEEERIAIDKANAMILSGVMGERKESENPQGFEDYREAPGGTTFDVLSGGEWQPASVAETAEIRAMIQNRRRR